MNPVSEKSKSNISASADENWSAIKKSDSRRLAEERAERSRYAEEYRKRLEAQMKADSQASDEVRAAEPKAENTRRAEERRALINEEIEVRKKETDERFFAASEMLKRLEEKQVKRNEFATITQNSPENDAISDTFEEKTDKTGEDIPTDEKKEIGEKNQRESFSEASPDDGIIRTKKRSYTVMRSTGAYAVPLVNMSALYAEYNRLAHICKTNEDYYKARIKALEDEHIQNLARLSSESERSSEDERYNSALNDLTVAYGAAMGGYITRQREIGAQIRGGDAAAENAASFDSYDSLKTGGYAEPLDWQPQVRREMSPDYAQSYSHRPDHAVDAEYSIDISGERPYDAATYDNIAGSEYVSPREFNQPVYNDESEAYTDTDITDASADYTAERQQHSSGYAYSYDRLVDTHRYDEENIKSDYSSEEGAHIAYSDEIGGENISNRRLDKRAEEDEHIRFLRESERLDSENRSKRGSIFDTGADERLKKSDIRAKADKSARLIALRIEYELTRGEADVDLELLNFSDGRGDAERKRRRLGKMKGSKNKAVKQERTATRRYYTALSKMKSAEVGVSRREKLNDIERRLRAALEERETIEAELTSLYGGNGKSENKVIRKAEKRRYDMAKDARNSLKKHNRRLARLHAPEALKSKIRELFDKKIEAAASLAYSKYLLKKQRNTKDDRKKLKREISYSRKTLAGIDKDIKRFMKKAQKKDDTHRSNLVWAVWLIGALIVVAGAVAVWYFFGDSIMSFFGV